MRSEYDMSVINSPDITTSRERMTTDNRFLPITDRVPVVSSWGIEDIKPRPGLITAAVVQRAAQLYSPYYKTEQNGSFVGVPIESLGIGLEDKLDIQSGGMAKFFAAEARLIKSDVTMAYPGQSQVLEELVNRGIIQNGGSELGRMQLMMLGRLDKSISALVTRLNKDRSTEAFDFRKKIYNFIEAAAIPEDKLISYESGKRNLAVPRIGNLDIKTGNVDLAEELKGLSEEELIDWRFLRSALFILSDPKVREVYEANSEVDREPIRYDKNNARIFTDAISEVARRRAELHRKPN